jgi:uncharacterized protein YndB with AHSA1/START domain
MSNNRAMDSTDDVSFTLTRTFDAPRDLVFKVWTDAEHLKQWWGPKGMALEIARFDLRPGGIFLYSNRMANGFVMWGRFVFQEIVPPERLVFVTSFTDEQGNPIDSPILPNWPREVLSTIEFSEQDGKTTLSMRGTPLNASELERQTFAGMHASLRGGWKGTFEQLENYLAQAQA